MKRHWFLVCLVLVLFVAGVFPAGGLWVRETGVLIPLLVAAVFFVSGFSISLRRLFRQALEFRAISLAIGSNYVVAPVLAYYLARLWGPAVGGFDSSGFLFLQSLMIAAAQATTLAAAIALTREARGDEELALLITILSNALTVFLTPLILQVSIGAVVSLPLEEMMGRMALVVLAPAALGQAARQALRRVGFQKAPGWINKVPQLIILVFAYTAFSSAVGPLSRQASLGVQFLGACLSLHVLMLAWTSFASYSLRLAPGARTAVLFCGSQKSVPNGIYLWGNFFSSNPYGAMPLVLYQIIQLTLGTLLVQFYQSRYSSEGS